jgi:hypothetical protein
MFHAQRARHSHTFTIAAPLADLFPLFTPIHEQKWISHWYCNLVYSQSPTAEELGVVFTTYHEGQPDVVWVLSRYEPELGRIEYVKFIPNLTTCHIQIACQSLSPSQTAVTVTYTLTGLSEAGNVEVAAVTEADYKHHRMPFWEKALGDYFATLPQ